MTTEGWDPTWRDYLASIRNDETVATAMVDLILAKEKGE